jgi:hypothetical protein
MGSYSWARNNSDPTLVTEIGITTIPYSNTGLNFQAFFGSLIQSDVIRIYNTPDPSTGYVNYEITNAGVFYSGGVASYVFEVSLEENNNWDNNITYVQTQINFFNSEDVQYNCYIEIPTPTPTTTSTSTPTPTNTPTPSVTSIPVTGYGYNLVVLPYEAPISGNTIFPTFATPGSMTGTTNPNTFNVNGIYWNTVDNSSVDRTSYYSGMTGVSVTAYFTQNGDTAIYSGSPTAFTFEGPPGQESFNYNPGNRPGQLILIQSASTNFVTGQTVYISYVVNEAGVTPTPTPTTTETPTPTPTPTPTTTSTSTPTTSVTNTPTPEPTTTPTNTETPTLTPTPTTTPGTSGNFNVTVSQQGPDVVWNGSGSFNTTSLISNGTDELTAGFSAPNAAWAIGDPTPPGPTLDVYSGVTTFPTSFGTSGGALGTLSGLGDTFGILPNGTNRDLLVPTGYVSGSFISGSTTYAGTTIAGMNLIPGVYTWSWGSGASASTLTMNIE